MTNFEKIKEMNIDEMAKQMRSACNSCICSKPGTYCTFNELGEQDCTVGIKKWLEEETIKTHEIKLSDKYCDDVYNGRKTFEIQYNDRNYQVGDYVKFMPMSCGKPFGHPLSKKMYRITYLLDYAGGLGKNFVIFAIKESKVQE